MSQSPPNDDSGAAEQPFVHELPLHLRILTIVFGLMFLATLVIVGHLMWTAEPPAGVLLERFFTAVESGRPDEVLALCDPALQAQIDQPVLAAWLDALKQNLGALQTVAEQEPEHSEPAVNPPAGRLVCGTARFERGSVHAELHYENGRLTDLAVRCDELPPNWCPAWR